MLMHGHLREQKGEKSIDETFRKSDVANDKERKAKNWTTQLKEYDADSFVVTIQAVLFLQQWQEDIRVIFIMDGKRRLSILMSMLIWKLKKWIQ